MLHRFKRERSSLSQLSSPVPDMAPLSSAQSPDTGAAASSSRCSIEHSTGLTPQGSKLFRATSAHPPAPDPSPAGCTATAAAGAGSASPAAVEATRAAAKRPCSEEASPREKRWRQGQMKPELAGMMERLQSLQAEFVQQQQQQQAARASPVRPNSGLGHATPTRKKLLANRRRSDSSAGCSPECSAVRPQLLLQQVQPASGAASPGPAATPPLSPGRLTPARAAAGATTAGKGSTKQPWASPLASGSAKSARRTVRRSPVSSPPPSMDRRQQAAAHRVDAAGQQQSPGAVFGSRTLARSMQRRKSTAADESAAPGEAAEAAAVLKEEERTTPAPDPPSPAAAASVAVASPSAVADNAASPQPAAAADNSGLLAALFGDDSPAPSPVASAVSPELGLRGDSSPVTSTPGGWQQAASPAKLNAAARSAPSSAVGTPAGTPKAPNTQARLAQLLDIYSSPEVSPEQGAFSARKDSSSRRRRSLSPTRRSLPRLDEVLRQGSRSPSLSDPSESSSPDRLALRSPLASSCSPQQQQHQQGQQLVSRSRASPSGIPSLQGSRRQLLEQNGRLDVSSECRVSIGTSIAARSPAKAAALGSPLAQLRSRQSAACAAQVAPSGVTVEQQAAAEAGHRVRDSGGRRDSIDLTPVPASGLIYTSNDDTPKVNLCGALTDSPLPAAVPHPQAAALGDVPAGLAAVRTKAGATVTPAGNHQVWPAWGSDGAWEVTPSPEAIELKKLWPGAAAAAQGATAPGGQADQLAGRPCSAASAPGAAQEGDQGLGVSAGGSSLGTSAGGTAVPGEAPLLESGSSYWVAQNPCYDMTPHGSAGRSTKNLDSFLGGSDAGALLTDTSQVSSLLSHPVQGLTRDGAGSTEGGADSCAGAEAEASCDAGVRGVSRHTSYASATSSPLELQLPGTPGSACGSSMPGSEPGSVGSSRGGSKRLSSTGGRFSGRGLQSLLGHSPSNSGPDSDCKPGSAAGMLGLLQRMKLGRSKDRSKSGSSAGGGCMSPQVRHHSDMLDGLTVAVLQHTDIRTWYNLSSCRHDGRTVLCCSIQTSALGSLSSCRHA
jgi:hypothetical protein